MNWSINFQIFFIQIDLILIDFRVFKNVKCRPQIKGNRAFHLLPRALPRTHKVLYNHHQFIECASNCSWNANLEKLERKFLDRSYFPSTPAHFTILIACSGHVEIVWCAMAVLEILFKVKVVSFCSFLMSQWQMHEMETIDA